VFESFTRGTVNPLSDFDVVGMIADGMKEEEILKAFPDAVYSTKRTHLPTRVRTLILDKYSIYELTEC
jgi:hypothetical protein